MNEQEDKSQEIENWEVLGMKKYAVTIAEAAELTRLSSHTFRKAIREGHLPVYRVGRRILVPVKELEAFIGVESTQGLSTQEVQHG